MKIKFLSLNNPCKESWDNMKPNVKGSFCDSCQKNVIDFTKLNQLEISKVIKQSKGNICARLTQQQLETPLFNLDASKEYHFPYYNIAAGLMIATSLITGQNVNAGTPIVQIEFVETTDSISNQGDNNSSIIPKNSNTDDFTIFKGKVNVKESGEPIENATIIFASTQKILVTHSLKDGTFSLQIPTEIIDNDNVIRVSYNEIINAIDKSALSYFETTNYILTKKEIKSDYIVNASLKYMVLGGIGLYKEKISPVVIYKGERIKYKEFLKAQEGKKSSCSLENKGYYYFPSKLAIAIYGEEAKDGLYIITE